MGQPYRWDVTGALNIVKFGPGFASNKGQLQRMSTILRVNAPAPLVESAAATSGNRTRRIYSQPAVGKSKLQIS
jgi:hypothetical protein